MTTQLTETTDLDLDAEDITPDEEAIHALEEDDDNLPDLDDWGTDLEEDEFADDEDEDLKRILSEFGYNDDQYDVDNDY